MRAGVAAGRALVSSLHRISHTPKSPFSSLSPGLLSKSIGVGFSKEHCAIEFGTITSPPFALRGVIDGHPRAFPVGGIEAIRCFRPRTQNYVFLQGLATQTPAQPPKQTPAQTPTRTPLNSKASSETKASSAKTSSSPPPPSTGTGKLEEKEKQKAKKSGIVKQMLLDFGAVPFPALVLGIAGLIPFVSLAPPLAQMLPLPDILAVGHANAQAAYGASIISFLGAIHWGLAMADYAGLLYHFVRSCSYFSYIFLFINFSCFFIFSFHSFVGCSSRQRWSCKHDVNDIKIRLECGALSNGMDSSTSACYLQICSSYFLPLDGAWRGFPLRKAEIGAILVLVSEVAPDICCHSEHGTVNVGCSNLVLMNY